MPDDWLLELGHTRLKLARRVDGGLSGIEAIELDRFGQWLAARRPGRGDRFWLAAVPMPDVTARVSGELVRAGLDWTSVSTDSASLPVAASYPGMGVDRWLALQPAWARVRSALCLVDCGTATTVDLVGACGRHLGGWIMPGMEAARQGLLTRAPGLRRPAVGSPAVPGPARDTAEAVESGLLLQQAGGIVQAYTLATGLPEFAPAPPVLLTGGAAAPLQSLLEGRGLSVRVEPDLVLQGLAMAVESMSER
ncbi:MAG: type III pantothenate kinase [Wenzhouxiangellaceae bacterium]